MYRNNFSNVAIRYFLPARSITATENNVVLEVNDQVQKQVHVVLLNLPM